MSGIVNAFKKHVQQDPNKIMLETRAQKFTITAVDKASDLIFDYLFRNADTPMVPMYLTNDKYVLPVVLGILKAGKIPFPLTIEKSLSDTLDEITNIAYDVVVTDVVKERTRKGLSLYHVNDTLFDTEQIETTRRVYSTNDMCYVVSTSGTTGKAKQIPISEAGLQLVMQNYLKLTDFTADCVILNTSPYTFDAVMIGLFATILANGRLVCFGEPRLDNLAKVKATAELIQNSRVTHVFFPPSYANTVLRTSDKRAFASIKSFVVGGEALTARLVRDIQAKIPHSAKIINIYGPSETTIFALSYTITSNMRVDDPIPIGEPIAGAILYFDESEGEEELWIGGAGVSTGYLNVELNKEKFILRDNMRYYKTGDIVRRGDDNLVYYSGRRDRQVKINGIRTELAGIDEIILGHEAVVDVYTTAEHNKLHIFIIQKEAGAEADITGWLYDKFAHMYSIIPHFVNDFPLTSHQKIDEKKLRSSINISNTEIIDTQVENHERLIKKLLVEEFHVQDIQMLDSLSLVLFFTRIEEIFNITIPTAYFYELKHIHRLIDFILQADRHEPMLSGEVHAGGLTDINNMKELLGPIACSDCVIVDTLYIQKNYLDKKYFEVLSFDISLKSREIEQNYNDLKDLNATLAGAFDIVKMSIHQNIETRQVLFKYFPDYIPKVLTSDKFIKTEDVADYMFTNNDVPQYFVQYNTALQRARFYFSHLIIDQFNIHKVAQLIMSYYYDGIAINGQKNYSYIEYIKYIKTQGLTYTHDDMLKFLPSSVNISEVVQLQGSPQCFKVNVTTQDPTLISLFGAFFVSQMMFADFGVSKVTGSIIANIVKYDTYDATHTIGDLHATYPFMNESTWPFETFKTNTTKVIDAYRKGLNIRDIIYRNHPTFTSEDLLLKQRWEEMNFAINYIGEKKADEVSNLLRMKDYGLKYIILFTEQGNLYMHTHHGVFKQDDYQVENFKITKVTI